MHALDDGVVPERIGQLAYEFVEGRRSGLHPTIDEYVSRHPDLAEEIRTLFPVVLLLEENHSTGASGSAPVLEAGPIPRDVLPCRLGEYELISEIGRGGMGVVFEGRHPALGRRVAIKLLPPSFALHEHARQRFLREARIIARLRHPQIVPIYAVGEQDHVLYFVTELIQGTSLDQLQRCDMPGSTGSDWSRWVARLGIQAAEPLAFAHSQSILHRDIKPSNFILNQQGKLWLTDFGLAKLLDEPSMTATGEWVGTLRYTAPECLLGEASTRSDIYGLGLTLYELLAGRPAYSEVEKLRLVRAILETSPAPLRSLDPSIPRELESVIARACERDPQLRYASAEELADDLRRFLEGSPIVDRRTSSRGRLLRWARRNPAIMSLSVVCALLVLTIFLLISFLDRGSQRPGKSAESSSAEKIAAGSKARNQPPSPSDEPRRQGPPWGFGRRFQPRGPGAGRGQGLGGSWRGFGPHSSAADREKSP